MLEVSIFAGRALVTTDTFLSIVQETKQTQNVLEKGHGTGSEENEEYDTEKLGKC